jgi:hypothetical protein
MASNVFPDNIKNWTDKQNGVDLVDAIHINEAYAEIKALEEYLRNIPESNNGTDNYLITMNIMAGVYFQGFKVTFKADVTNTDGSTLNVNTIGEVPLVSSPGVPLKKDSIKPGQYVSVIYNSGEFQMLGSTEKEENNISMVIALGGLPY